MDYSYMHLQVGSEVLQTRDRGEEINFKIMHKEE